MKMPRFIILLVDDSLNDQTIITRAFRKVSPHSVISCVSSGQEAVAYLNGAGQFADRSRFPYPNFLITDLKMPMGDGFALLENVKHNPEWAVIPTVVLSESHDPDNIKLAYLLGASSYFVKPHSFGKLVHQVRIWCEYWSECETPEVDQTGRRLVTDSAGKLGERFHREPPGGARK